MKTILLIALGGALGSVARYLTGKASLTLLGPHFPWGTMIVNIVGSLAIGVIAGLLAHFTNWSQDVRQFAVVGVLGGYTTFSAFALDAVMLSERGSFTLAMAYVLGSVVVSIAAVMAGLFIVRNLPL